MSRLGFISDEDFKNHIKKTIKQYDKNLKPYDKEKFNSNVIDPIKLIFDKNVYGFSWEEIIKNEVFRQRDKSTTNDIGYFHQNFFNYITGCTVPPEGWDVIVKKDGGTDIPEVGTVATIYVEMKNKHNTMNSASAAKTYMKMQNQVMRDDDSVCFLVEAIAKRSQNITWQVTLDGEKIKHKAIRRVSMDKFYEIVTGKPNAFYDMCMYLPEVIEEIIKENGESIIPKDTVYSELQEVAGKNNERFALALYMLGFPTYNGFSK